MLPGTCFSPSRDSLNIVIPTAVTIVMSIIYIGENLSRTMAARVPSASIHCHHLRQPFRAMFTAGITISPTATGRTPRNILSTTGLSLISVKSIATRRIITKDGSTAPMVAATAPGRPRRR